MGNAAREAIVSRIRKLLALARGGTTEEEAAAATRRAHELLAAHNLELAEVESASRESERRLDGSTVDGERETWPVAVWHASASLHFCRYFYSEETDAGRRIGFRHHLIGLPHNIAVTKLTAKYLIETVHRLAQEAGRAVRPHERRSYRASFRTACARRLAERMAALRRHPSPSMAHSANGRSKLPALLSLYDAESRANEALLRELGIDLTRGALRDRLTHAGGAEAGRLAAETIPLHPQVSITSSGAARTRSRADVASGQLEMFC